MQKQDYLIVYLFLLGNVANFIQHCELRGLSQFEADRIIDELEELANG